MSNGTLAVRASDDQLAVVESIVQQVAASGGPGNSNHFGKAFRMAAAIRALHKAITDEMMGDIMALQGTALGFLTDKDKTGGYDVKTVKLVMIEAALMGAHWVGNEVNIISERPYLTKNFFTRTLREFPGFTDLKLFPGVPALAGDKGALVPYVATWKLNGAADRIERLLTKLDGGKELDERICVKVNAGMGADAILGKAERKIKAAIYGRLTGSDVHDGDVDDVMPAAGKLPARTMDQLADRLDKSNGHDRPQTTDGVDEEILTLARTDIAAESDPDAIDFAADELIKAKQPNDATVTAIRALQRERKSALKPSGNRQKALAGT